MLVDTNTIIEAHRTRAWAALAGDWRAETVEDWLGTAGPDDTVPVGSGAIVIRNGNE